MPASARALLPLLLAPAPRPRPRCQPPTTTAPPHPPPIHPQLAEGLTFADHFWRTYPSLFLHKCEACNGAGSVICPSCKGYKLRSAAARRCACCWGFEWVDGLLLAQTSRLQHLQCMCPSWLRQTAAGIRQHQAAVDRECSTLLSHNTQINT